MLYLRGRYFVHRWVVCLHHVYVGHLCGRRSRQLCFVSGGLPVSLWSGCMFGVSGRHLRSFGICFVHHDHGRYIRRSRRWVRDSVR